MTEISIIYFVMFICINLFIVFFSFALFWKLFLQPRMMELETLKAIVSENIKKEYFNHPSTMV
jgi:hypothetical protein